MCSLCQIRHLNALQPLALTPRPQTKTHRQKLQLTLVLAQWSPKQEGPWDNGCHNETPAPYSLCSHRPTWLFCVEEWPSPGAAAVVGTFETGPFTKKTTDRGQGTRGRWGRHTLTTRGTSNQRTERNYVSNQTNQQSSGAYYSSRGQTTEVTSWLKCLGSVYDLGQSSKGWVGTLRLKLDVSSTAVKAREGYETGGTFSKGYRTQDKTKRHLLL